eukprot:TRINITY_DN3735_c0_g2_i5.p1 TRINITY_DN3735_c0_g2~~TRINITY_DN3735_c0_g2_i5.p1  ORF type:complete len:382 (-),score=68.14 TRINITY_DN3735_c0_g2_i5:717-1862(-)
MRRIVILVCLMTVVGVVRTQESYFDAREVREAPPGYDLASGTEVTRFFAQSRPDQIESKFSDYPANCRYGVCRGDPWLFLTTVWSDLENVEVTFLKNPLTITYPLVNFTVFYKEVGPYKTYSGVLDSFRSVAEIKANGKLVKTVVFADAGQKDHFSVQIGGLKKETMYEVNVVAFGNGTEIAFDGVLSFTQTESTRMTAEQELLSVWVPFLAVLIPLGILAVIKVVKKGGDFNVTRRQSQVLLIFPTGSEMGGDDTGTFATILSCSVITFLILFICAFTLFLGPVKNDTDGLIAMPCYVQQIDDYSNENRGYDAVFTYQRPFAFHNSSTAYVLRSEVTQETIALKGKNTVCYLSKNTLVLQAVVSVGGIENGDLSDLRIVI